MENSFSQALLHRKTRARGERGSFSQARKPGIDGQLGDAHGIRLKQRDEGRLPEVNGLIRNIGTPEANNSHTGL